MDLGKYDGLDTNYPPHSSITAPMPHVLEGL